MPAVHTEENAANVLIAQAQVGGDEAVDEAHEIRVRVVFNLAVRIPLELRRKLVVVGCVAPKRIVGAPKSLRGTEIGYVAIAYPRLFLSEPSGFDAGVFTPLIFRTW